MGKSKSSNSSAKAKAAPKCTCDHPYKCDCGNRPERPSKGHKWDPETQTWGGKGHKQKGASGQTSSVAKEATTTTVGKTKIEQYQRLPSQLLSESCRKEGRPPPKYKSIGKDSSNCKYRVIIQDAKVARRGTDHDLILVPSHACANVEQAKEEAALLGLFQLTPKLPHERKLPEPYKTTWLHAVQVAKQKPTKTPAVAQKVPMNKSSSIASTSATASTNLTMANSYVSMADKRRKQQEKQKARKEKIRKHEQMRMANRDHQVFLSAKCRKRIETLLRGGANLQELLLAEAEEEEREDLDEEGQRENDVKYYVTQRLHHEGFLLAQVRTAFAQVQPKSGDVQEDEWHRIYDECLQWLCIHLDEDQLPEGFDPRGRTLDVVVAPGTSGDVASTNGSSASGSTNKDKATLQFSDQHGITYREAELVLKRSSSQQESQKVSLWKAFCQAANTCLEQETETVHHNQQQNLEIAQDECEALEAIFAPEEFHIEREDRTTIIVIRVQSDSDSAPNEKTKLEIVMQDGSYPMVHPRTVLLTEGWTGKLRNLGAVVHVELIKFMATLALGDPMVYEIYGHVQSLLHAAYGGELAPLTLLRVLDGGKGETDQLAGAVKSKQSGQKTKKPEKSSTALSKQRSTARPHRPRERSFFWSTNPRRTPPATSFPKLSTTLERARKSLPAAKARDEFLSIMKKADQGGRVVLVTGETGCGKTTQIPQFILEEAPLDAKIVVAQPRRLAATGVAARVANERGETEAGKASVGYVVRGDTAMCNSTRLMFCTTGVLLRQLQNDGALDCISHIIVDEVHERHLDTDVLLGVLKECIEKTPHLRVVLMSATLDADRFAAYWGKRTPRMHIPGRTFPVEDFTLEDVLSLTGYIPPKKGKKKRGRFNGFQRRRESSPWDDSEKSDEEEDGEQEAPVVTDSAKESSSHNIPPLEERVRRIDENNVDYDLLGQLVKHLVLSKERDDDGSILVFLSGAPEINKASETIRKIVRSLSVQLLPLHGGLQPKDQNLVFRPAQKGSTKVILSTNVAETSITIPDCTIVIDSCREKQSSYDPSNRMPLLVERFASKDSLKQRRGRSGRVRAGTCYKLISRSTLSRLPEHGEPEIRRCALDQTLLSLLFLGIEHGSGDFLKKLLDPPSRQSIHAAILSLEKLGAVTSAGSDGTVSLTPLGMHLAGIPAPPSVGKLLVMGCILGCRSASLAMAAGMSVGRSPFLRINTFPPKGRRTVDKEESLEDMKQKKVLEERDALFKKVGNSDHALLAAAFMKWDSRGAGAGERKRYCETLGLSFNGMREMKQLVRQLGSSLASVGYVASSEADRNARSWRIIRCSVVAALAPSQIARVHRPSTKYSETAEGAVEKDGVARELKFFIRGEHNPPLEEQGRPKNEDSNISRYRGYHGIQEERVFMHPSSANFRVGSYNCPWLVYHELVRTSKAFLRDATECSAYALLLFGGKLEVQAAKGVVVIDDWVRLAANARIGALIGGLRRKVDELLSKKVKDPSFDIAGTAEARIIVNLLVSDGLGQ